MNLAIVVYRNPVEEWLWESGFVSWVAGGLLVIIFAASIYVEIANWFTRRRRK